MIIRRWLMNPGIWWRLHITRYPSLPFPFHLAMALSHLLLTGSLFACTGSTIDRFGVCCLFGHHYTRAADHLRLLLLLLVKEAVSEAGRLTTLDCLRFATTAATTAAATAAYD